MGVVFSTATGSHETVEELLRYAARSFEAAHVAFRPSRMSKFIRQRHRVEGSASIRQSLDSYLDRQVHSLTWAGFELFAIGGYADPTGAHAAQNVDRARGAQ